MNLPDWCYTLSQDIYGWIRQLQIPGKPGYFTFCKKENLFFPSENSGLDASALALKIYYIIGALHKISQEDKSQWLDFIRSFQQDRETGRIMRRRKQSGFFLDQIFLKQADRQLGWFRRDLNTRRAVTRQACAALMCAGSGPRSPVTAIPDRVDLAKRYLHSFDWNLPWGAGSHVSHLVFFLNMNKNIFGIHKPYNQCIPVIFEWLDQIRKPDTGSWYTGNPSTAQKINGAMKILTAYGVLNKAIETPELLIDFCLNAINQDDGCHNADILFVLHYCHKYTDYRKEDIQAFCWKRIEVIEQFRKSDGAFSFYPDKSQTMIYGVPIARGEAESDLHGTILFLWSLKMIVDILGYTGDIPLNMPIT